MTSIARTARGLAAVAVIAMIAACGGGGSGNADPGGAGPGGTGPGGAGPDGAASRTLHGLLSPAMQGAPLCLDTNRDLACSAGEPATTVASDGGYVLVVPDSTEPAHAVLVVELAADSSYGTAPGRPSGSPAPFVLAGPAGHAAPFGVVSTLAALRMQADSRLDDDAALADVRDRLGLAAGDADAAADELEEAALPALREAAAAAWHAMPDGPARAGAALKAAGPALEEALRRYVDPATGALWPSITERTLATEAVAAAAPRTCSMAPLEVMRIQVDGNDPVFHADDPGDNFGKETYHDATISIDPGAAYPAGLQDIATEIKGRGNTTWTEFPKKPYRLKLRKPARELLGMPAARNWALLANYSDKTGLRNATALCLSEQMGLRYTIRSRFVELYFNGEYQGVYQLAEHKEVAPDRVDVGPDDPAEDVFDPEAGWLLEMDTRTSAEDEDPWFTSGNGREFQVKSDTVSDKDAYVGRGGSYDGTLAQIVESIRTEIDGMEAAFRAPAAERFARVAERVDVEELVDNYLINEFLRNVDGFWSGFLLYRPRGGRIIFGPLWDFDLSAGNDDGTNAPTPELLDRNWCPEGWYVRHAGADYLAPLLADPEFARLVVARWRFLASRLPDLGHYIDSAAVTMADAQHRNFSPVADGGAGWDIDVASWPNWVVPGSYAGEVDYLQQWLQARADWMSARIASADSSTPGCAAWRSRWASIVIPGH